MKGRHSKHCIRMSTVSARVPEELEQTLEAYLEEERLDRSVGIRRLLEEGLDRWRRERAVERFVDGEVSLGRAAEMAGVDVWTFTSLLEEEGVPWVSEQGALKDLESA